MKEQARVASVDVERPHDLETTARGAAMLAAVGAGIFPDKASAGKMSPIERIFEAPADEDADATAAREASRDGWKNAIARTVSSATN